MRRTFAACVGCLLMLSSSWSFALGSYSPLSAAAAQTVAADTQSSDSQPDEPSADTQTPASPPASSQPAGAQPTNAPPAVGSPTPAQTAGPGTAPGTGTGTGTGGPLPYPQTNYPYPLYPNIPRTTAPAQPPPSPQPPPVDEAPQLTPDSVPQTQTSDNSLFGSLPNLGSPADAALSLGDEAQIGQIVLKEIRDAKLLLDDPEVDDYLQTLGMRLASEAHDPDQQFHYHCVNDTEINSFATFGGQIFIFTGLILITNNESELAAVMAHETGHVVQRHIARDLVAQEHMSIESMAAMLAAVLIGVASRGPNNGEATEGAIAMANATEFQRSINFTRTEEIEADYVGIHLLASAGFDPNYMAEMFERMGQFEGLEGSEIPAILQDHPVTPERIAAARERADQFPRLAHYTESESYPFIKERVRVLSATPDDNIAQYYAGLRAAGPLTPAERYGEALVQMRSGHAAAAVPTLRELRSEYPALVLLYSALGQALAAAGQTRASLAEFAQAEQLFPRNVPLTVDHAETLMTIGEPEQAHRLLLDLFNLVEPTPPQIQLTALAANAAGDTADAYYYMGQYNLANGDLGLANQELELALRVPHLSNVQRERFRAMLQQVRDWIREQQQARHHG